MNKVLILLSVFVSTMFAQQKNINHNIVATVVPAKSNLTVIDEITFPDNLINTDIVFTLNSALKISKVTNGSVSLIKKEVAKNEVGMDHDQNGIEQNLELNKYLLEVTDSKKPITIYYSGKIISQLECLYG